MGMIFWIGTCFEAMRCFVYHKIKCYLFYDRQSNTEDTRIIGYVKLSPIITGSRFPTRNVRRQKSVPNWQLRLRPLPRRQHATRSTSSRWRPRFLNYRGGHKKLGIRKQPGLPQLSPVLDGSLVNSDILAQFTGSVKVYILSYRSPGHTSIMLMSAPEKGSKLFPFFFFNF